MTAGPTTSELAGNSTLQTSSDCFASGDRTGNSLTQEQMGQKTVPLASTALSATLIPRVAHSAELLGPPSCDFEGLWWCVVSKGRIWSQGSSVTESPSVHRDVCCHASAAMQGPCAELVPTFLTLAVLLEKGKDVSGRKTERGECLPKCTKWTH